MVKAKSVTSTCVPGGGDAPDGFAFPAGGSKGPADGSKGPADDDAALPLDGAAPVGGAPPPPASDLGRFAGGSATSCKLSASSPFPEEAANFTNLAIGLMKRAA